MKQETPQQFNEAGLEILDNNNQSFSKAKRTKQRKKHRWGNPLPPDDRGYDRAHRILKKKVLAANPHCVHCAKLGKETRANTLDHIRPKCLGGRNKIKNLQGLCSQCSYLKSSKEGHLMRAYYRRQRARKLQGSLFNGY